MFLFRPTVSTYCCSNVMLCHFKLVLKFLLVEGGFHLNIKLICFISFALFVCNTKECSANRSSALSSCLCAGLEALLERNVMASTEKKGKCLFTNMKLLQIKT